MTQKTLESWENDGIVNTASMLWPDGAATRLVKGDHGDIIGHYQKVETGSRSGRRFQAYDLLRSDSGFTDQEFKNVWNDVLEFCVDRTPPPPGGAAPRPTWPPDAVPYQKAPGPGPPDAPPMPFRNSKTVLCF
ncbi:hypothetical protein [Archangium sp.]|uniref:hypothetical protein n=1 Tax=Archangium sp. TaxID=1872627 RepID=UPI00286D05E7|nr:hypothetical protein [Archangium sp.]